MKRKFLDALDILLSIIIGLWIAVLIADMLLPMMVKLCNLYDVAIDVVRIVGYITIVLIVLYIRTQRTTCKATLVYKISEFKPKDILITAGISFVLHMIMCFVFKFAMYMSGAGYYFARSIFEINNPEVTIITGYEVSTALYAVCTMATHIIYFIAVFLSYKSGYDKAKNILTEHEEQRK